MNSKELFVMKFGAPKRGRKRGTLLTTSASYKFLVAVLSVADENGAAFSGPEYDAMLRKRKDGSYLPFASICLGRDLGPAIRGHYSSGRVGDPPRNCIAFDRDGVDMIREHVARVRACAQPLNAKEPR